MTILLFLFPKWWSKSIGYYSKFIQQDVISCKLQTDRRTDRQTDRQTENTIHRAAWSQLKTTILTPGGGGGGGTPSLKVVGRLPGTHRLKSLWAPKRGVKILWGQKSICGHKKGGQYSMSHWKIGVKILCVVLKRGSIFYGSLKNRGQNSM